MENGYSIRSFFLGRYPRSSQPKKRAYRAFRPRFEQVEDRRLLAADLTLDIEDAAATVEPGGAIVYSFEYANVGDEAANGVLHTSVPRGSVFNAEASHESWTCEQGRWFWSATECSLDLGEVGAEAEGVVPFAVTVDSNISTRTRSIYNAGFISGDGFRRDRNDQGSEWTPIARNLHDLQLKLDSEVSEVAAGGTINYTLNFSNQGSSAAPGAKISLRLPEGTSFNSAASSEGWTCDDEGNCSLTVGEVAPGAEGQASFVVTLDSGLSADVRHVSAWASIADDGSGEADKNFRNNRGFERDRIVHQLPDLSVKISDDGARAAVGQTIVYSIDYANEGLFDSTGVALSFDVPRNTTFTSAGSTEGWICEEGTCSLTVGNLAKGTSGAANVAVTIDSEPSGFWRHRILASVSIADDGSAGGEQSLRNNRDWESTSIVRNVPDLSLSLNAADADVLPGGRILYTLTYENKGLVDATGSMITMRVPRGTSFTVEGSTNGWNCDDGSCTLEVGTIAPGTEGTATFAVTVEADFSSTSRRVFGFAFLSDDGTNGREDNWRNNGGFAETKVMQRDPTSE